MHIGIYSPTEASRRPDGFKIPIRALGAIWPGTTKLSLLQLQYFLL